jgi:hypothetical protein
MFGINKKIAGLPWATRIFVVLPLALLGTFIAMRIAVSVWVSDFADSDPVQNEVSYDSSFLSLNGDFGATNFKVVHNLPDGTPIATFTADRLVFHTPGLHWLWWSTLRGSKNMPDRFGVTLENFKNLADGDEVPGNYTNLPYDQIGCGTRLLTPARLREMGMREVRRDVSLALNRKEGDISTISLDLLTHDAGQLTLSADITVERPVKWRDTLAHLAESRMQSASLRLKDLGFVERRNAFCAKAAGVEVAKFGDLYMRGLAERFAEGRFSFNAETMDRLRRFNEKGGELVLVARNPRGTELPKFVTANFSQRLQMFPATVSWNGGPEAPFRMDVMLPGEIRTPAAASALPVASAAPAPVAAAVPASTPTTVPPPTAAAAMLSAGTLSYADLKGREGAHIEIVTSNGTVRRGILLAHSSWISTLKLDPEQGGFTMTIPGDSVEEVRAIPAQTMQAAAPAAVRSGSAGTPGAPRG